MDRGKSRFGKYFFRSFCLLAVLALSALCYQYFFSPESAENNEKNQPDLNETAKVEIRRGSILDRFGRPLAVSLVDSSIYVKPREFSDLSETTEKLAGFLGLNSEDLLAELKTQKSFIWLARHIPYSKAEKIADLNLSGVYIVNKGKRVYPHNFKVPGIIGEVSQEEGLSGLEYYYNDLLLEDNRAGKQASDLFLTLDLKTQILLEKKLSVLLTDLKFEEPLPGQQTTVKSIVMNSKTGGIIACAQQSSASASSVSSISLGRQSLHFFADYVDPGGFEELFRQSALLRLGQRKKADNATEGIRIITPGGFKKNINPPPGPAWRKLEEGDLVYPWFAGVVNEQKLTGQSVQTEYSLSGMELAAFSAGLGFSSPVKLDLPRQEFLEPQAEEKRTFLVDKGARVLPLNLLSGFSCIMTGESRQPHFFRRAVSGNGKIEKYQNKDISGGICNGIGNKLLTRLKGEAESGDSVFVVESLQPGKDCRTEDNSEDSKNVECINGVTLALSRDGERSDSAHELVMLVIIEKGLVDLYQPSPVKPVIKEFLKTASENLRQQKKLSLAQGRNKVEGYLNSWLLTESEKIEASRRDYGENGKAMPDLRGMSIRQALRQLQDMDLQIFVHGSGIIIKQYPEPGEKVESDKCVLTADFHRRAAEEKKRQ